MGDVGICSEEWLLGTGQPSGGVGGSSAGGVVGFSELTEAAGQWLTGTAP